VDHLEGYKDEGARDESRAWVALLEGIVQGALVCDISFLMRCRVYQLLIGPIYCIDHWYGILAAEILSHLCIAATPHRFTSTSYVELHRSHNSQERSSNPRSPSQRTQSNTARVTYCGTAITSRVQSWHE
jgi:hypothetical protein